MKDSTRRDSLDGVTILRYAHIYRHRMSGGMEQYLNQLDRGLLSRHRLTIIQTHLVGQDERPEIEEERIGIGRILWVPLVAREGESLFLDLPRRMQCVFRQSRMLQQAVGIASPQGRVSALGSLVRHRCGHLTHKVTVISDHLVEVLSKYKVDLLLLHWLSYDTGYLIQNAMKKGIRFALINHFDNRRLSLPEAMRWLPMATAIGSVSKEGLSFELSERCINLSDAIDTNFFNAKQPQLLENGISPILLHPARIQAGKGHEDLLLVAQILRARGVEFTLYFVGAVDSVKYHDELCQTINSAKLRSYVKFKGELNRAEIRDLYASSSVVVLPSRSEGLPRVLLEAQAMGKPVVAYRCGGVSEAFLPNKSGFLVDSGDVEALVDRIVVLLRDKNMRTQFGVVGREYVARCFSVPALIQRHESFYLDALLGYELNRAS